MMMIRKESLWPCAPICVSCHLARSWTCRNNGMAFLAGFDIQYFQSRRCGANFFFPFFSVLLSLLFLEAGPKFNCIIGQILRIEIRDHSKVPASLALCDLTIETELSIIKPALQSLDPAHMPRREISGLPRRIDSLHKKLIVMYPYMNMLHGSKKHMMSSNQDIGRPQMSVPIR